MGYEHREVFERSYGQGVGGIGGPGEVVGEGEGDEAGGGLSPSPSPTPPPPHCNLGPHRRLSPWGIFPSRKTRPPSLPCGPVCLPDAPSHPTQAPGYPPLSAFCAPSPSSPIIPPLPPFALVLALWESMIPTEGYASFPCFLLVFFRSSRFILPQVPSSLHTLK